MAAPPTHASPVKRARVLVRVLFLVLIPLVLVVNMCARELTRAGPGFSFALPPDWTYLSATSIEPRDGRIRFSSADVDRAFAAEQAAPLFAVSKYARPHPGLNPLIGVNVALAPENEDPVALLDASVAEVQRRTDNALTVLAPVTATNVVGHPAARVELGSAATPAPGQLPDKMTVVAIVAGPFSFMIAGSGAYEGSDEISRELARFVESLALEPTR